MQNDASVSTPFEAQNSISLRGIRQKNSVADLELLSPLSLSTYGRRLLPYTCIGRP